MCVSEGFPALPFFVNEDLTRSDGVIRCRQLSDLEIVRLAWRFAKVLKYLRYLPIEF